MYCILTQGGVMRALWGGGAAADSSATAEGMLGALFSAAIHDYGHLGVNNDFLIQSGDDLALRYNDRSPMENHHLVSCQ